MVIMFMWCLPRRLKCSRQADKLGVCYMDFKSFSNSRRFRQNASHQHTDNFCGFSAASFAVKRVEEEASVAADSPDLCSKSADT